MKTKQGIAGFLIILGMATAPIACESKTERKAEKVQDAYKDAVDARQEGDTSEMRETQADLDTARQEYRELAKDTVRKRN
ncbi:hypothetical protein [Telluribacter sp.]|jgi:hypothetical protein|uniref:hypothetical protein n=1 Tax=Telluribacter sp. TaxID=1978767 RepID=UPI002E13E215|nr:hypothetical protein [Telluribacter sp.]